MTLRHATRFPTMWGRLCTELKYFKVGGDHVQSAEARTGGKMGFFPDFSIETWTLIVCVITLIAV